MGLKSGNTEGSTKQLKRDTVHQNMVMRPLRNRKE